MTRSASTPRLRLTLLYFVALLVATALCAPRHPPGALLQAAALLLVAGACLGRIWCSVFIAGRKDAAIVTHGPYALCRHPLYSLSFVGGIGLALATGSFTLVAATAIVLAAGVGMRLGFALLFTGGLTRADSMRQAGRAAMPAMGVTMILFLLAALIEGYISPSAMPYEVKALFGVASSLVLMIYFVVLGAIGKSMMADEIVD